MLIFYISRLQLHFINDRYRNIHFIHFVLYLNRILNFYEIYKNCFWDRNAHAVVLSRIGCWITAFALERFYRNGNCQSLAVNALTKACGERSEQLLRDCVQPSFKITAPKLRRVQRVFNYLFAKHTHVGINSKPLFSTCPIIYLIPYPDKAEKLL